MDHPGIYLVEEHFVAREEQLSEHILYYRVPRSAPLMQSVEQLSSPQPGLLDFSHQTRKRRKQLCVECQSELQTCNRKGSVFQILVLDRE